MLPDGSGSTRQTSSSPLCKRALSGYYGTKDLGTPSWPGVAALTSRATTGEALESEQLKAKLGAALIERDLLHEKIALLEAGRPVARRRRKP
jgi:hypothetical protein